MTRKTTLALLVLVAAALTGCTYYRVTDPATSKAYYTHNWDLDRYETSGALQFKDARSGRVVTLQNSEVEEITEDEFERGLDSDG